MAYKAKLKKVRHLRGCWHKAGMIDLMLWVGIGLFVAFFVFGAKPKDGILQYANLNEKGLYVKDFNGQEHKAYIVNDNIYVNGEFVGRRVSAEQIPNE
jgi:hypothetical protein